MRALHRRSVRGTPKPQGAFRGDATPRPCQGCGQAAVPQCPRCGHHVCAGCAALVQDCPVCRDVDAYCRSCAQAAEVPHG